MHKLVSPWLKIQHCWNLHCWSWLTTSYQPNTSLSAILYGPCPFEWSRTMRSKNTFPSSLPLSQLLLLCTSNTDREWGLRSVRHCSGRQILPLLWCGILHMGDSSLWASPTWVHPKGNNSPPTGPTCVIFFHGYSHSGTACSSVGPPQGHKPYPHLL